MKTQWLWIGSIAVLAAIAMQVTGGDLNPGNTPSPTMRTLDELYRNIQPGLPSDWLAYPSAEQAVGSAAVYLTLSDIPGSCQATGQQDSIRVVGLGHQVELPYEMGTGQISGQRLHGPMIITKYIDKSSPLLYQALVNNQTKSQAELKFYRDIGTGQPQHYYTIRLNDVKIIKIQTACPNMEQVSIAFRRIRWIWLDGGIEFEDDLFDPA